MKEEQITQIVLKQSKLGRPVSKPDPEIVEMVLEHVALGGTLRAFCRQKGMPSYRTLYRWLDKDQEFLSRFTYCLLYTSDAADE